MIKQTSYIRKFTDKQKELLSEVMKKNKIKSVSKTLIFCLEKHEELIKDFEPLERINNLLKAKIEKLKND